MARSPRGKGPDDYPHLSDRSIEPLRGARKIVFRPREVRFAEAVTAPEAPMRVAAPHAATDPSAPMRSMEPGFGIEMAPVPPPAAVPFPDVWEDPTVDPNRPITAVQAEEPWTFPWRAAAGVLVFLATTLLGWLGVVLATGLLR